MYICCMYKSTNRLRSKHSFVSFNAHSLGYVAGLLRQNARKNSCAETEDESHFQMRRNGSYDNYVFVCFGFLKQTKT
jgi:uncharacterized protein YktB (UPF0637 family)